MMCKISDICQSWGTFLKLLILGLLLHGGLKTDAQQSQRLIQNWQFLRGDLGSQWEAIRPAAAGSPQSVPLWEQVTLPHCFNARDAVDPDVNYYQGPGWYRSQVKIRNPYKNGRTLLHFEGAGQKTRVYIDSIMVAEHIGGYDEWTADITTAVTALKKLSKNKEGKQSSRNENDLVTIVIRCDNTRDAEMIPSDMSDFNLYGGLYRYLNLVYEPEVSIARTKITPIVAENLSSATVQATLYIKNTTHESKATMETRLLDPDGKVLTEQSNAINLNTLPQSSEGQAVQLPAFAVKHPQLWSPETPKLYTFITTITCAGQKYEQEDKIGFRRFEFKNKGPFYLNGKRLLLKGTHRHEDHAGIGAAMPESLIRKEMTMIKEMGVNFIRLAHYQQSPIVLRLCDSLGLLVWEEVPWCRGGLGDSLYQDQGRSMLTSMIQQHYNHPSVMIWGMGNEIDWPGDFPSFNQQEIRRYLKSQNTLAHFLDSTRLTGLRRCDFAKDLVDVYSPSIWAGWYRGIYTEYKSISKAEFEKVPHFIHIEWGADSHAGRHSENPDKALGTIQKGTGADERTGDASLFGGAARASKDGDWSETYACNLIDWHLKEQETMPWLTGSAYWIFKDFSTPLRPDNPVPYVNQKGVVERDLTKKEAYYVFQSYWTTSPMVHLYGHSWPVRWGKEGEQKMVKVYSNCDQAELFVNGVSMGTRKRNSQDFPAAGLRWMVPMKQGKYHFKVVATKNGQKVTDQIDQDYQSDQWGEPKKLVVQKISARQDTAVLEVKLYDNQNIQCLDAKNIVRFSLAGDGILLDDLGTSSGSRKVELYNGRARIRVKQQSGQSVISVSSKGLPSAFLSF